MVTFGFEDVQQKMIENRNLLTEFPFLWPIDDEGNRIPLEVFKFHQTQADKIPPGWRESVGNELFSRTKEIMRSENIDEREYIFNHLRPSGGLRIHGNIKNEKLQRLFDEIEYRTERMCSQCGRIAEFYSRLDRLPFCNQCIEIIKSRHGADRTFSEVFVKLELPIWVKQEGEQQLLFDGTNWKPMEIEYKEEQ